MIPKTVVEHDQSGLEMVIGAMAELQQTRFIEGIKSKHRTLYEVEQTTEMVRLYQARVNIEARALVKFSETFIRQFATENNKCFETAEVLFVKIRSTIAGLKKIFYKTTPRDYRQLPEGAEVPTVFEKSPISHGEYTPDMFGLDSYPEPVRKLYEALDTLFTTAATSLALCHQMSQEESETRQDIVQLRQIYKESCDELLTTVRAASDFLVQTKELPDNELEKLRQRAGQNRDKFLTEGYHRHHKKELTQFLVIKCVREGQNDGLTDQEALLWPSNHQKALQARQVIEHYDEIEGVEGQEGKLSSTLLVQFIKWSGVEEQKEKEFYTKYFCESYKPDGHYKTLGWNSISAKRKDLREGGFTDAMLAEAFSNKLQATGIF